MEFPTLDGIDVRGKTVLVRVDINSPIDPETKEIIDDTRFRECAPTIRELSQKGAKVVVLAHQGRPGSEDYTSLGKHARKLEEILGTEIKYVDDVCGSRAIKTIRELKPGEILLLENVRSIPEEMAKLTPDEHARSEFVKKLSEVTDLFVNDAFGAAHRGQASLVGFALRLPACAGRLMERELKGLGKARDPEHPCVYVLGGLKIDDSLTITEHVLSREIADSVLVGGVVGHAVLVAAGYDLGKPNIEFLRKKCYGGEIERAKKLLETYGEKIKHPLDVAVDEGGKRKELEVDQLPTEFLILDIGKRTVEEFSSRIKEAKTVVANGPLGAFESPQFAEGTFGVLNAMAKSDAFTVIGGGHIVAAARGSGVLDKIKHVSTGGGACINFLSGRSMPAIDVLVKRKTVTDP